MIQNKLLFSLGLIIVLGINPSGCLKGCKGCGRASDDIARHSDDAARHSDDAARYSDDAARQTDAAGMNSGQSDNYSSGSYVHNTSDGYHSYRNQTYYRFEDIPFHPSDNIYFDNALTSEQAAHLMSRGVNFVYNRYAALSQGAKPFKLVYLISDEISAVQNLYDLDYSMAQKLIEMSAELLSDQKIIKVSSYSEMIAQQNEILANGEVPVFIFHNNQSSRLNSFSPEANFITCNSFELSPESYLSSTTVIDMRAVIKAINYSYSNGNLEDFYRNFTAHYSDHMKNHHRVKTLIYIGVGVGTSAGVGAIAYYNSND